MMRHYELYPEDEVNDMVDVILLGVLGLARAQGELIESWLHIPRISSGDLFRDNLTETELGRQAKVYMDRGSSCR